VSTPGADPHPDPELALAWSRYALGRIRVVVDKPREDMTDDELTVYTHAASALAGGDPTIALFVRGPGHRLCRICGAEWSSLMPPDHVAGCPLGSGG
jgi:hypothetical protein